MIRFLKAPQENANVNDLLEQMFNSTRENLSDPIILHGLRMIAFWHTNLLKQRFGDFLKFAIPQLKTVNYMLVDIVRFVERACTPSEWFNICNSLRVKQLKKMHEMAISISLFEAVSKLCGDICIVWH